jgi:hypothetical protein
MKRAATGVLGGTLALVLLAAGCSLGPREDWAKAMRDARKVAERSGGAMVKQVVTISAIETNIRARPQPLLASSTGTADFRTKEAEVAGSRPRKLEFVYDDLVVYGTRSEGSPGAKQRPWARFDYGHKPRTDIDANDRRMAVGAAVISPVLAVELLGGILTGSVKNVGTGMKAGVQTTHYTARLAPDASIIDVKDEDRKEGITRMFDTLGVQQDDFPVDAWIDDQGLVRGIRFTIRQQKDRVNVFKLVTSWEYSDYGDVGAIEQPPGDEVLRTGRFRDFVTELIRSFG